MASEIEGKSKGDVLEAKCFKKERSTELNTTDKSNEMRTEFTVFIPFRNTIPSKHSLF